jgi:aspartate carbamoyltransferase catalytic subunit
MAMHLLGGKVVFSTEHGSELSSAIGGGAIEDTIKILSNYRPDVIVLRTSKEGMVKRASEYSSVPIINAGDGLEGQHPLQALIDLLTIWQRFRRIDHLITAIVGELARGRTARTLCYFLGKFPGNEIYLISPEIAKMQPDIKDYLQRHNARFTEGSDIRIVAPNVDVIYLTQIDDKRRAFYEKFNRPGEFYMANKEVISQMKEDAVVMHPFPRGEELPFEFYSDRRAAYFQQAKNGRAVGMALLKMVLI